MREGGPDSELAFGESAKGYELSKIAFGVESVLTSTAGIRRHGSQVRSVPRRRQSTRPGALDH